MHRGVLQIQLYTLYGRIHVDQIPYFVYSAILQHPLYGLVQHCVYNVVYHSLALPQNFLFQL